MTIRRKIALWLCPQLGEQLSACRTAWAKHMQLAINHEGIDFLHGYQDVMTEQEP